MAFWSVCQTESSRENVAVHFLGQSGYVTYLPKIRERKRVVPLFPAYVFLQIEERWWSADNCPGVVEILKAGDVPARLADSVVDKLRGLEHGGLVKLPKPRGLQPGDKIRIVRGSFAGHIGVLAAMTAHQRQLVLLDLLGQKVKVELPETDTAPLHIARG